MQAEKEAKKNMSKEQKKAEKEKMNAEEEKSVNVPLRIIGPLMKL
jgi:hypothetical protein